MQHAIGRAPAGSTGSVDLAAASSGGARCPPRRRCAAAPVAIAPSASRAHVFTYPQGTTCSGASVHARDNLKEQLRADLTAAMKARDELVKATLRMTLTAIGNAEVAGTEARELTDDEVLKVIAKEAKKRAESAEAFAGRRAARSSPHQERAEGEVLARYLPQQLTDDELAAIARTAVDETAAELGEQPGPRQMGQVMKRANAAAAGRADGGRVAAAVKALLVG